MRNQIVVSLYNEKVDWINKLEKLNKYEIYVYNKSKGCPKEIESRVREKKIIYEELENVGRESHTYLYHIRKHWRTLGDKIFFTQAEPFDHIDPKNDNATNEFFFSLLDDFFNNDYDFKAYGKKHWVWHRGLSNKVEKMRTLWEELFETPLEEHEFNNGGIFGVKKDLILNRSKNFYDHCLKSLSYHKNPAEGFCFERMWVNIFNVDYKSKI